MAGNGSGQQNPDEDPIVVSQSRYQLRGLLGFLALAFALALVRGAIGAATTTGRVAVIVIFGAILAGCVAALATAGKRLDRLEVTEQAITYVRWSGQTKAALSRQWGDEVRFVVLFSGRFSINGLNLTGTEKVIGLPFFSRREVRRACATRGWRFAPRGQKALAGRSAR